MFTGSIQVGSVLPPPPLTNLDPRQHICLARRGEQRSRDRTHLSSQVLHITWAAGTALNASSSQSVAVCNTSGSAGARIPRSLLDSFHTVKVEPSPSNVLNGNLKVQKPVTLF